MFPARNTDDDGLSTQMSNEESRGGGDKITFDTSASELDILSHDSINKEFELDNKTLITKAFQSCGILNKSNAENRKAEIDCAKIHNASKENEGNDNENFAGNIAWTNASENTYSKVIYDGNDSKVCRGQTEANENRDKLGTLKKRVRSLRIILTDLGQGMSRLNEQQIEFVSNLQNIRCEQEQGRFSIDSVKANVSNIERAVLHYSVNQCLDSSSKSSIEQIKMSLNEILGRMKDLEHGNPIPATSKTHLLNAPVSEISGGSPNSEDKFKELNRILVNREVELKKENEALKQDLIDFKRTKNQIQQLKIDFHSMLSERNKLKQALKVSHDEYQSLKASFDKKIFDLSKSFEASKRDLIEANKSINQERDASSRLSRESKKHIKTKELLLIEKAKVASMECKLANRFPVAEVQENVPPINESETSANDQASNNKADFFRKALAHERGKYHDLKTEIFSFKSKLLSLDDNFRIILRELDNAYNDANRYNGANPVGGTDSYFLRELVAETRHRISLLINLCTQLPISTNKRNISDIDIINHKEYRKRQKVITSKQNCFAPSFNNAKEDD